jgi:hypothetical protein
MITRECRKPKEAYKITIMATLMTGAVCLTIYSHLILKTGKVFTHLFYVPIVLSSVWWKRKGLVVTVFLGTTVITSSTVFLKTDLTNNLIRVFVFILISSMVLFLDGETAENEKGPGKAKIHSISFPDNRLSASWLSRTVFVSMSTKRYLK